VVILFVCLFVGRPSCQLSVSCLFVCLFAILSVISELFVCLFVSRSFISQSAAWIVDLVVGCLVVWLISQSDMNGFTTH
jgi:hypothetical protein